MSSITRSMTLRARQSAFNSSVTLYEPADIEELSSSFDPPKKTRRIKRRDHDAQEPLSYTQESTPRKRLKADATSPKKMISLKKTKLIPQALASPHPAPENWREVYDTIGKIRSRFMAPVDTMGCDQAKYQEIEPEVYWSVYSIQNENLTRRRTDGFQPS